MPKHTFGSLTDEDEKLSFPSSRIFVDREYVGPSDLPNLQRGYGTAGYGKGKGIGEDVSSRFNVGNTDQ